eukprot:5038308-Pleurochrysis_carterae.AAC.1
METQLASSVAYEEDYSKEDTSGMVLHEAQLQALQAQGREERLVVGACVARACSLGVFFFWCVVYGSLALLLGEE